MKKLFVTISVLALILLSSLSASALSGEGTEASPYEITTEAELLLVKDFPNSWFELKKDITVSDTTITLGNFNGNFNGNNHTINIGFSSNSGTIKNVCFENTGILSGDNNGIVENCSVTIENRTYNYDELTEMICIVNYGVVKNCQAKMTNNIFNILDDDTAFDYHNVTVNCFLRSNESGATIEQCSFTGENLSIGTYHELTTYSFNAFTLLNKGMIKNCYSKCNAKIYSGQHPSGHLYYGHFYGMTKNNTGRIINSYILANVTSKYCYTGFDNDSCTNTYSCINENNEVDGTSKTALAMTMKATYEGWDFDTIWAIDSEVNEGYPYLQWQYTKDAVDVTSVTVDKSEVSLNVGESDVITATVLPDNATNKNVLWASSDTSVATVVSGTVTAVGAGNATITVTTEDGNYKALCSVVVNETSKPTEPSEPTEPDAENTPTLRIESVTGKAGETVTVALNIENNPGILGMMLKLTYDERLALSSVVQSTGEEDSALETLDFTVSGDLALIPLNVAWEGLDADSTNGKILNMTFIIPEDAEDGTVYDISASYTKGEVYDNDMNDIEIEIVDGSVTVKSYTIGDINDDGIINIKDITLLRRGVVGGYGVTLNEAADVNCDGIANIKDITIIRRYVIGGYGVTLGK